MSYCYFKKNINLLFKALHWLLIIQVRAKVLLRADKAPPHPVSFPSPAPSPAASLLYALWPHWLLCCSLDTLSPLLPQGLLTCCSLCLEALALGIYVTHFLTFLRSLLSCHLLRGVFINHFCKRKKYLPSFLSTTCSFPVPLPCFILPWSISIIS